MKNIAAILVLLAAIMSCAKHDRIPAFDRIIEVSSEYIVVMDQKYSPPFELIIADSYEDGGTWSFVLRDSEGKKLLFCEDWRIGSKTRGRFYFGGYPEEDGLIVKDRNEETKLVSILHDSASRYMSEAETGEMDKKKIGEFTKKEWYYLMVKTYLQERLL